MDTRQNSWVLAEEFGPVLLNLYGNKLQLDRAVTSLGLEAQRATRPKTLQVEHLVLQPLVLVQRRQEAVQEFDKPSLLSGHKRSSPGLDSAMLQGPSPLLWQTYFRLWRKLS